MADASSYLMGFLLTFEAHSSATVQLLKAAGRHTLGQGHPQQCFRRVAGPLGGIHTGAKLQAMFYVARDSSRPLRLGAVH
jgi:hypothetical protein